MLNFAPLAKLFPRCPPILPGSAAQPPPPFPAPGAPSPEQPLPVAVPPSRSPFLPAAARRSIGTAAAPAPVRGAKRLRKVTANPPGKVFSESLKTNFEQVEPALRC